MSEATDVVELTKALVRIDSINPPGNEEPCARWLKGFLEAQGFATQLIPFGARRYNLVAELRGRHPGPMLGFSGHMDTVPLGGAPWTVGPLTGELLEGRLYGRGSTDMKSGIAAFVVACLRAKASVAAAGGVRLLLTGGEETGCEGARALRQSKPDYLDGLGALIVGEPTQNYPFIGHKGALWLKVFSKGVTAHGAMPEAGDNAIYKVVEAINKLRRFELVHRHPLMGGASMNVGTIRGGLNVNSVPDHAAFEVDLRTVPGMVHNDLHDELAQLLGDEVRLEPFVDVPPLEVDQLHPWIQRVYHLCALHGGAMAGAIVPKVVPYFTDGSVLVPRARAVPVVILGPGEPQMMHKTDEYCRVDRLEEGVRIYEAILKDWAGKALRSGATADRDDEKNQVT